MSRADGESIQESLERLNTAQSTRTPTDAGRAHAQLVRDAKWLGRLTLGFGLGFSAAILSLILITTVAAEWDPRELNWPGLVGLLALALGCAAMIATFLVNAAWMIVDFGRWLRAWRYRWEDHDEEPIQEGLARLSEQQGSATESPAPERPPRDRDARVLFRIVSVCAWSMIAGLFLWLPLAAWSVSPSGVDLVWLNMLVSVVAWTLGTSFFVSTAAIALLFILNPRRYWRAWVQIRNPNAF